MQAVSTATDLPPRRHTSVDTSLIGAVLGGRYRVISRIGSGGMGEVYLAEHRLLGCRVALKTLRPNLRGNHAAEQRFRREAELGAVFSHPNLVRVFDFDIAGSVPYLVMEFLEGQDLRSVLTAAGPLPIGRAVHLICGALEGLGVAHERGIIHRDLKPSNLFVVGNRQQELCKLLDFGVAGLRGPYPAGDPLTLSGCPLGTLAYMAPEQIRAADDVDARADVYSAAAVLFELISGRPLLEANSAVEHMFHAFNEDFPQLKGLVPECRQDLARVIMQGLARDPNQRFPDGAAFARALAPFAESWPVALPFVRSQSPTRRWAGITLAACAATFFLGWAASERVGEKVETSAPPGAVQFRAPSTPSKAEPGIGQAPAKLVHRPPEQTAVRGDPADPPRMSRPPKAKPLLRSDPALPPRTVASATGPLASPLSVERDNPYH